MMSRQQRRADFVRNARGIAVWFLKWPGALGLFFLIVFNSDTIGRFLRLDAVDRSLIPRVIFAALAADLAALIVLKIGLAVFRRRDISGPLFWPAIIVPGSLAGLLLGGWVGALLGAVSGLSALLVIGLLLLAYTMIGLWLWSRQ